MKKISVELEVEAYKVADFIQELSKIQNQYFEALWEKTQKGKWMCGFQSDEVTKDWLFDYLFNGADLKSGVHNQTFSEYCASELD